ncbi:SagB/ThcOx family dehydrogenase [Abyssisolibacter fermentans]|uniref:SagB/ThcOx family dehydrogenase n=1 Tax=Abyssisolibacter fermentans TaxID=1766203 RepID=UPI00082CC9BF|nr:SagB/ThcOx family dehydrogenase [Abyssisolibacter fermentans]
MRITKEYLDSLIENGRNMLKPDWNLWNPKKSDEGLGIEFQGLKKSLNDKNMRIKLDLEGLNLISKKTLSECIERRKSTRDFSNKFLSFKELSYLIWETCGVNEHKDGYLHRTIPSAGGKYCLNTYMFINRVEDIQEGLYLYLPDNKELVLIDSKSNLVEKIDKAMFNQMYNSAITFIWTAMPYKMEYRYYIVSHKMIAIEAGHACQNLYLASEAISCGCCAISAYKQRTIDKIVKVDGDNEFVIYMAIVGKEI